MLKSKIFDFETFSNIHVCHIEYVLYRQGPYQIRIDTAADCIVPALLLTTSGPIFIKHLKSNVYVTLNAIGSFLCNLCFHWMIQIFIT